MYFSDSGHQGSQESVEVDPDIEAFVHDGWTQTGKSEKTVRVSVSLPR